MPEDRPRRKHNTENRKNNNSGWQLVLVQSISCIVVILIVFLFKLVGGTAFKELRDSFNKAIMSNSLMATIAALFEPAPDSSDVDSSGTESTTESSAETSTTDTGTGTQSNESTTATESTTGGSTEGTGSTATGTSTASTANTTSATTRPAGSSAAGGNDIRVTERKVMYAPEGATFAPLRINRLPHKPLQNGKISSFFGYRTSPLDGEESFHQGMDIAAEMNSPIAAMYFGVVTEVGANQSYGNYVKIYHGNGIEVLYAHCSKILANKDAIIRAGEIVAQVGSTGQSTGPHLHIEIRVNGIAYDPLGVIQRSDYA